MLLAAEFMKLFEFHDFQNLSLDINCDNFFLERTNNHKPNDNRL